VDFQTSPPHGSASSSWWSIPPHVLYTDGIVEAENSKGEFYSAERLKKLVLAAVGEPAHNITTSIYDDVRAFRGSDVRADDVTLIIMKVL
jgi:phosphoserine phosphatase RsbU/P